MAQNSLDKSTPWGENDKPTVTSRGDGENSWGEGDAPVSRGFKGWGQDIASTTAKAGIGLLEMPVGLADIVTGGRVGKFLENEDGAVGFRPKQGREIVNEWHSDATKEAQRKFQEADGVVDKFATAVQNPSLIATAVGESLPSMFAGGVLGRGALAAGRGAGVVKEATTAAQAARQAGVAGALGEGASMAGSQAEQIRQETEDGLLTGKQAGLAALTGVAGGAISRASAGLSRRLGIGDADTMLVQGTQGMAKQFADDAASVAANPLAAQVAKSLPRQVIEGAIVEGLLEELPQSVSEQILQNLALDKPWADGLDDAIVMGTLSGGVMGAGAAGLHGMRSPRAKGDPGAQPDPATPASQDGPSAPPTPGADLLRTEWLARMEALAQQEQGEPAVPQTAPPDGRAALEAQRVVQEQARAAEQAANRAVTSPDDEIYQSTGMTTPRSVQMGLNPDAGGLEGAAALAVDVGASDQMQQAAALAQRQENGGKPEVDAETGEIDPTPTLAERSDADLVQSFRGAQSRDVRLQLAQELQRRRAEREQKALQAELDAEQTATVPGADNADAAFVRATEVSADPMVEPATATKEEIKDVRSPDQAQQAIPEQPQAGGQAPTGRTPAAAGTTAPEAGGRGEQAAGLTDGAPTANAGAQAAPAASAQGQAQGETREQRAQRIDEAGARWMRMPETERAALVGRLEGVKPILARNMPRAEWAGLNADLQRKLADAMQPAMAPATQEIAQAPEPQAAAPSGPRAIVNRLGPDGLTDAERAAGNPSYADPTPAEATTPKKPPMASKEDVEHLFGIDKKRAAAIERINSPKGAFFMSQDKAKEFIKKNGLSDTHEVVPQNKAFHVKEKAAPSSESAEPQWWVDRTPHERYRALRASGIDGTANTKWKNLAAGQQEALNEQWGARVETSAAPVVAPVNAKAEAAHSDSNLTLRDEMSKAGWLAETDADDNTIWTRRAGGELYTATLNPGANSIEVTVPVNLVNTQIASLNAGDPTSAASSASKAIADDAAESVKQMKKAAKPQTKAVTDKPNESADPFAGNKLFTADKVAAARERMRKKLGTLNSGIDPEMLVDGMTVAGAYIESGVRNFTQYAKAMIEDMGEGVKPYLLSFWEGSRNFPGLDTRDMTDAAESARQHQALLAPEAREQPKMAAQASATNQGADDAAAVPTEQLSQGNQGRTGEDATTGNRNRQSVDDGLAQARDGADRSERVPAGTDRAGGSRADGVQQSGQPASGPARDSGAVRPEQRSTDAVAADPATAETSPKPELDQPADFTIDAEDIGKGGLTKKYRDNIAAIRILKALASEERQATPDERKTIARYVGWGALKGVFDKDNKQWGKEFAELRELLTDAEYRAARASTLNAHYTSPDVVKGIFGALERLGFTHGRVLEPSVGVGNFFGLMPASMRKKSQLHGVELDPLTSQIAAALYPSAKIAKATGFQDFEIPGGYFDVAIGNPPFGNEPIVDDARSPYSGASIHNYFFAKSIDKLRPGGVMAMVVSHNFLDARNDKTRKWIAERANLLAAVRLPNTAFKENAGTEVVTDILVFQRKTESEQTNGIGDDKWVGVGVQNLQSPKSGEQTQHYVSQYFIDNPGNVLGTPTAAGSMYRADEYTVEPRAGETLATGLDAWVKALPQNAYQAIERTHEAEAANVTVPDGVKVGSFFVDDKGEVQARGADVMGNRTATTWTPPNAKAKERMAGMIGLRDSLRAQMRLEKSPDTTDEQIEAHRRDMNERYDAFQKAHGYVNDPTNRRLFLDDTESALLLALEFDYDRGVSKAVAEREGIDARPPSAVKADIFTRRVMFPPADNIKVQSARDALLASLNYKGGLDMGYMASLYDKPEAEIVKELGDVVFTDPVHGMVMADEYLSGDVKTKLAEAEAAALDNPEFKRNVQALRKVIPADKRPSEIHAAMGASFIPGEYFEQFAKEVTGSDAKASYVKTTGQWLLNFTGTPNPTLNVGKWGIGKMPAVNIFTKTMAGQGVVVTETHRNADGSTTTVVLEKETAAAREKQAAMKAEWQRWLWADPDRADRIASIYNEKMNRLVTRQYDGEHMTFPGMSPAMALLPHQKNAVWRGLQSRQVLLDHTVGAGKTFEVVALFMEMRRLGIARKPFIAVPNHLTLQWRSEFSRLYPAANVLAATPDDFAKGNREKFFSKIITGDWDAVIVGHSSLKKIGLPPETERAFLQEQIDEISAAIEEMKRARGDRNIVRDMEGIKARLDGRMKQRMQSLGERDKVVTFDELGVDAFAIDELHEFKSLFYNSTMERVPGMGNPGGSDKSFDLFVKLKWMFDTYGDKAPITGATGTPVSNSLVEMFNMQRLLQYPTLKRDGLHVFDAWAKQFGSVESLYEVSPSGTGYRQSSRFAKFKNLPALMAQYQTFADTVTLDDLKAQEEARGKAFPVPKIAGGRPVNVVAKRSPQVANFMGVPQLDIQGGKVQFGFNGTDKVEFKANEAGDYWTATATGEDADGKPYQYALGGAKTEEDARLLVVEQALSPKIKVDPNSILGQFADLKRLNKETKGKVNALSLTGQANKAGLDYRLIDPAAPDFEGSKINLAVDRMMATYHKWADDKGTQLVFCDLSVPLSARSGFAGKERRVYVRDNGALAHKKGTMHTAPGHEQLPFLVVKEAGKDAKGFTVYDAATGLKLHSGLPAKGIATDWAAQTLADEAKRQRWIDARDQLGDIQQDEIDDYNNANEIDTEETEAISLSDIAGASGAAGFSVYDDIKKKLIARGVPEREIAFIHDYGTPVAKDKLFKAVNAGNIRFLLGSTPKMGAGTNVQKRLVGLHHIDAPWRPSDLEQREGRIVRRGNDLYERDPAGFEVEIYRYATEQTYDTRRWQILEHKARGIEQLRNYDGTLNEIDDIEGEAANSADMKAAASGDPLILEETQLRNDVRRLESLQASHADESAQMVRRARDNQRFADEFGPKELETLQALKATADANPVKKDEFAGVTAAGKRIGDREAAIKAMRAAMERVLTDGGVERIDYRGIEFTLEGSALYFELTSPTGVLESIRPERDTLPSVAGFLTRFANYINRLPAHIEDLSAKIEQAKTAAVELREQAGKPFAQAKELDAAREAHKKVQRRLIAKGPDIPVNQRAQLKAATEQQREALRAAGLGDALNEFMGGQDDAANFGAPDRPRGATPTGRAIMDMVGEGRDARDILRMVAGTSASRFNRQVARLLMKTGVTPSVELVQSDLGGSDGFRFLAKYSRRNDTLTMTPAALSRAEHIFMHEMIHAATLRSLDRNGLASLQMRRLYEHVKKQGGAAGQYGMKNVGEFVAEVFTNPEFQRELRGISAPSGSTLKTAWDSFLRILKRILGLPSDSTDALSRALDIGVAVMREDMSLRERGSRWRDPDGDGDAHFGAAEIGRIKTSALDQIHQTLTHPGKVSLWDKTVGTMRHLAERNPAFKPVFEAAQRFIDDVSMLGNDAADYAPRLIPRVETMADLKFWGRDAKKAISAKDNDAVARPLFEGTLMWGRDVDGKPALVDDLSEKYRNLSADDKAQLMLKAQRIDPGVLAMWRGLPLEQYEASVNSRFTNTILEPGLVWKNDELKSIFGMSDDQISLYREARAGIDRSIDMTARADMLRVLGDEYAPMRDAVLEAPTLTHALNLLVDTLEQQAQDDPETRERLADHMHTLRSRFETAEKLQDYGYAPLSRFGRYTVDVVDQSGERQYFGMFETMREANLMRMRMASTFPGATVTSGTMSQEAFKLFQGITPESLEMFGNMLGLQSEGNAARDRAFQQYLQLAKNNHSALKRLIHRKGIAGYSEDVGRVLASFIYSNARLGAGGLNAGTMENAIQAIPKEQGELKDVAMGLQSYISDPQEEGQAVRGMLFAQYLGGSLASAMVNMTQPFAVTMPWMSQYGGMKKAGAQLARALNDMRRSWTDKGFKYEDDLAKALQSAEDDGVVSPQEIHQLMAQARGTGALRSGDGTRAGDARAAAANAWTRTKVAWGQPFALAEQFNRRSTFIAAYRLAKDQGMQNPAEFARRAVLETQFLYSKANKPKWARGAIGGTLFTFKTYSVSYLELMQRTWNAGEPGSPERAAGRRAVAWALAMLMLMGGAGGLPFMEDVEDLIDGIGQLMGRNISVKQWRKQFLRETLGNEFAEFVDQGISGLPGAPIDVSGRLGMGNLLPGTGLLLSKQNRERDLLEVVGPAGDLIARGFAGGRKALTGDLGSAALEVSPTAVRNAAKGVDMATSGIYKDTKGYKVIDTTLGEALAKAAGFQPRSVAEVQEANSFMQRSKSFYIQQSSEIKAQWAQALFNKDDAALERVRARLAAWNENNPDQRITVSMPDIWKRVREMGKDRSQRIADTAPKALRQQMRDMANEAR